MTRLSSKFHERLAVIASANPDLVLQNAYPLKGSNTAFRINATHAEASFPLTKKNYCEMLASVTDNKFKLIPDTLAIVDAKQNVLVASFIAEANTEVKDFDENLVRDKMRVLSANVFVDDEDSIWKVQEGPNGTKHLVQQIREDFGSIIAARINRGRGSSTIACNYPGMVPSTGDYVAYFNVNSSSIGYGYATVSSDLSVFDRQLKEPISITSAQIVEIIDGESLAKDYNVAKYLRENNSVLADDMSRGVAYSGLLSYYRNLYAGTDYMRKLEELVAKKRKFNSENVSPISTYHS